MWALEKAKGKIWEIIFRNIEITVRNKAPIGWTEIKFVANNPWVKITDICFG